MRILICGPSKEGVTIIAREIPKDDLRWFIIECLAGADKWSAPGNFQVEFWRGATLVTRVAYSPEKVLEMFDVLDELTEEQYTAKYGIKILRKEKEPNAQPRTD